MGTTKITPNNGREFAIDQGYVAHIDTSRCVNCGTSASRLSAHAR